jgi:hypothetical protein
LFPDNRAKTLVANNLATYLDNEQSRFRPVADGYIVPNDLCSIYQAARFNDTPILIGNTSDEAAELPDIHQGLYYAIAIIRQQFERLGRLIQVESVRD